MMDELTSRVDVIENDVCIALGGSGKHYHLHVLASNFQTLSAAFPDIETNLLHLSSICWNVEKDFALELERQLVVDRRMSERLVQVKDNDLFMGRLPFQPDFLFLNLVYVLGYIL